MLGVVSIVVAVGGTALVGKTMDLPFFVVNVISMIGLAVGIDYALFIIERYREERRNGLDKMAAIELAGGTASKAVLFSGLTVIFALSGMVLLPTSTFQSRRRHHPRRHRRHRRDADPRPGAPERARRQDQLAATRKAEAGGGSRLGLRPRNDPPPGSGRGSLAS